ncbi:hypothetical protein MYX76_14315 [Desulfobacterota bacterium AH_259_B03_O07]|nr:hypothetical protein [Desulfobacterota bacterium AH_259_B03_O07]
MMKHFRSFAIYILFATALGFLLIGVMQMESQAKYFHDLENEINITDELEQEEREIDEELYHGDKKQDLQYDKEQNEFIDGSEQDEINYELKQEKQDLENKKQTMEEIDAIEEEINEQP